MIENPFLIEIRLMGGAKHVTRQLIYDIYNKFHVRGAVKHRPVPHVSLFGPFRCRSINDVVNAIGQAGSKYSELGFQIDGFDYFELKKKFLFFTTSSKKNVIFLKIVPSEELKVFRYELAKKLLKITDATDIDKDSKDEFRFHTTIALKDIDRKFDEIWGYLENYKIKSDEISYRVTLLRKGRIVYEYDLQNKRLLTRKQVLAKRRTRNRFSN